MALTVNPEESIIPSNLNRRNTVPILKLTTSSYVSLSKKEALRVAGTMLSEVLEGRGGRIPMHVDETSYSGKTTTTYWIG